ncbi:acetylglutamate kinase [Candidatus Koribacter versatilis Ellin345]|uniref:Acetylglutamate kinase n=1 Tax=Koribacter versatilis (strain Ellin345) TaxID=204669 RepID=ARGB_KORVE|nr:acetylglutamate kinase [Candidatus Koribacter versatilis]Q1IIZ0.1 RecName: Full=Acetylglutamate kinase; AltName: Full=N-acetyl-L-glutamate 5-phosphotransferase; AltName: Full=NAG kinase; Short=NAGK [Candidatus Koribacter versatilis Ellin345]ABF43160.1 acetylglutamate kinase [Candidatus Koribacter versatilis Ellin345]
MKIVLKIGGAALENKDLVGQFCTTVASLAKDGHHVLVVHGGGAALSRTLKELGIEPKFLNGLRVTDARTRDVALMVLGGLLNKQLAAAIGAVGQPAIGLCGSDLHLCVARKKPLAEDLGFVGEIASVNEEAIAHLWANNAVPVVASLAQGADGEFYNINADEMASALAAACIADTLIFLTDVPGVKDANGDVLNRLGLDRIESLIANGIVSGGMLPKLEACKRALQAGVGSVRILPATKAEALPSLFESPIAFGTELVATV